MSGVDSATRKQPLAANVPRRGGRAAERVRGLCRITRSVRRDGSRRVVRSPQPPRPRPPPGPPWRPLGPWTVACTVRDKITHTVQSEKATSLVLCLFSGFFKLDKINKTTTKATKKPALPGRTAGRPSRRMVRGYAGHQSYTSRGI